MFCSREGMGQETASASRSRFLKRPHRSGLSGPLDMAKAWLEPALRRLEIPPPPPPPPPGAGGGRRGGGGAWKNKR